MKYLFIVTGLIVCFSASSFATTSASSEIVVLFRTPHVPLQTRTLQSLGLAEDLASLSTGHPRIQVLRLKSPEDMTETLRRLRGESEVQFAEPNYPAFLLSGPELPLPNDPMFQDQWYLHNTGKPDADGNAGVAGADIHILPAWNAGFKGSRKILVAIVDGGMDGTHPDLVDNLYSNPGETGLDAGGHDKSDNGIDDDQNGFIDDLHGYNFVNGNNNTNDENGHGSHIAGVIGAGRDNGIGVSGINQEVSMMPIKAFNGMGAGTLQTVVAAISYAIKMRAHIINNSWAMGEQSDILQNLIGEAQKQGILVVAGAGNSYLNLDGYSLYPVSYRFDNILGVAATDNQDLSWRLTDVGPTTVHVAAPGVNLVSTWRKGAYKADTGTSMATPVVAGIAALVWAAHPEWTYKEVKKRIIDSCVPSADLRHKVICQGRVDAWNAVQGIKPANPFVKNEEFKSVPVNLETEHPYPDNVSICYAASRPGAKHVRLHIQHLELEWDHDHAYLEDPQGRVIEELDGYFDGYTTDYVDGDSLQICLKTDRSRHFYGFKVDALEYAE